MHQALYRKWRPKNFDEVSGQEHITSILRYEIQNNAFSHAYLFCGSRGTGKTTCAKILAKAVNCENPVNGNPCGVCAACRSIDAGTATDVIEMDAASNNGVDDIRDIREGVAYTPAMLRYRVYIVDEVHMLSSSAFNALLKTLEEPPAHVIFILATTELQKLPATIISRCQRFEFRRMPVNVLAKRLLYIAQNENINITQEAAQCIGRYAQGGMRDAISLMELCSGTKNDITVEAVNDAVGSIGRGRVIEIARAVADKDYETVFAGIDAVVQSSRDIAVFWQDLISLYRDMLVVRTVKESKSYLDLTDTEYEALKELTGRLTRETLTSHIKLLDDAYYSMQRSNNMKRICCELALVRMCDESLNPSGEALISRISKLEDTVAALSRGCIPVGTVNKTENSDNSVKSSPAAVPVSNGSVDVNNAETVSGSSEPTANEINKNTRILRQMRGWNEVIDRVKLKNPMSASFLADARAYTDAQGKIVLKFGSQLMIDMIKRYGADIEVQDAVSSLLNRNVAEADTLFEADDNNNNRELIDEIIADIGGTDN